MRARRSRASRRRNESTKEAKRVVRPLPDEEEIDNEEDADRDEPEDDTDDDDDEADNEIDDEEELFAEQEPAFDVDEEEDEEDVDETDELEDEVDDEFDETDDDTELADPGDEPAQRARAKGDNHSPGRSGDYPPGIIERKAPETSFARADERMAFAECIGIGLGRRPITGPAFIDKRLDRLIFRVG